MYCLVHIECSYSGQTLFNWWVVVSSTHTSVVQYFTTHSLNHVFTMKILCIYTFIYIVCTIEAKLILIADDKPQLLPYIICIHNSHLLIYWSNTIKQFLIQTVICVILGRFSKVVKIKIYSWRWNTLWTRNLIQLY